MTPRRLDPSIVQARLSVIRAFLDDLAEVAAAGEPPLAENRMLRHGVERILTQLVELATAINEHVVGAHLQRVVTSYRDSFELAEECGLIDKQLRRSAPFSRDAQRLGARVPRDRPAEGRGGGTDGAELLPPLCAAGRRVRQSNQLIEGERKDGTAQSAGFCCQQASTAIGKRMRSSRVCSSPGRIPG